MPSLTLTCHGETDTQRFGETLAFALKPGTSVWLQGELGAGKTTLARAVIRAASGDPLIEVPSPTFTLMQTYEELHFGTLAHLDLYRLEDDSELQELGLDEVLEEGTALIEWPQRARHTLPEPHLIVELAIQDNDNERLITVSGQTTALIRLQRSILIRDFLNRHGHGQSRRQHLTGDASARTYETVHPEKGAANILMNAPAQPDGPPIRDGKPYSRIAHLAEDVGAFVGVGQMLVSQGFNAPEIFAQDLDQGLLLIEDLGSAQIIDDHRKPVAGRYKASVATLAAMHEKTWPTEMALADGRTHRVPDYDTGVMMIEAQLLIDWYLPWRLKREASNEERQAFNDIWEELASLAGRGEQSLVLRDYHSPNIIWLEEHEDPIGLIDFQDALMGPTAYDVASLAQDARVDIPSPLERDLVDHYCTLRAPFDEALFRQTYAIMAAQRATKILGIFVRLSKRDGKHGYLAHLPRMEDYIRRSLAHPALEAYRHWLEPLLKAPPAS